MNLGDGIKKLREEAIRRDFKKPIDEFKNYESFLYTGPDFFGDQKYYGAPTFGYGSKYSIPYDKILDAYSKTKGKFAKDAFTDPEIKEYYDSQMARKKGLYDRVRKVPKDKWGDFAYQYGYFSDPFDFEGEDTDVISPDKFIETFDYGHEDWDTLEEYLKERGY